MIDFEGIVAVVVDLHDATATDSDTSVFADTAERARLRGQTLAVSRPPAVLLAVLRERGLDDLVAVDRSPARRHEEAVS